MKNKKLFFNILFKSIYLEISNKLKTIIKNKIFLISFIFIIFVYIAKIILISFTALIDDEAYYVLWTKHLPFGFFDHGPGIAYFLKLSLTIFGYNGFGARIGSVIFSILVSVFLYKFIRNERDENSAIISIILFNIIPFFSGLSLIVTIDTPMFYFIIFSIMAYYKSIFYDKKYFYLSGALIGFSILSKINSVFIIFSIMLFILLSSKRKEIFLSIEFYLSFLIIIIFCLPFIVYIIDTDFAPVIYIIKRLGKAISINRALDFWGAQIGLFSPLFFILFVYLIIKTAVKYIKKETSEKDFYFAFISLIPFLYILQKSFKNKLEANWALFMYAGGLFLVSFFISQNWHKRYIRNLFFGNIIFCMTAISIIILQYFIPIIPIKGYPTDRYFNYNAIRYDIKDYYKNSMNKDIRIFSLNYQIPSMINFYVKPEKEAVCLNWDTYHPTSFDFWYNDSNFIGNDFYYISTSENTDLISKYFEECEYITNFQSKRKTLNGKIRLLDNYHIFLCRNYKGRGISENRRFKYNLIK